MSLRMIAVAAALGLAAYAAPVAAQAAKPAAKPMTYDCTKAGNKNKAACKNVAAPAAMAPAAKPMAMAPAAKPMAMAPAAKAPAKPMNYDCTKAGNKNKAACKNVMPVAAAPMAAAKPMAAPAAMAPAKPAPAAMAAAPAKAKMAAAPKPVNPNIVTATEKNGKVVHYDCSKAGNKTKKACKAA
jgi:hypothetical protein